MENIEQLTCKICAKKRLVTEEEMRKYVEYRLLWEIDSDDDNMFVHFNRVDKKTCPGNKFHEYGWNMDFYENMLLLTRKLKNGDINLTRNNNENIDLEKRIVAIEESSSKELANILEETDRKIKEINEKKDKAVEELRNKIEKNRKDNEKLEKEAPELEQNILNQSGQSWKEWL